MQERILKCAHHTRDGWGGLYQWDTPTGEAAYFEFEEGLTAFLEGLLGEGDGYLEARRAYEVVWRARVQLMGREEYVEEDVLYAVVVDIRAEPGWWDVTYHSTALGWYARERVEIE